LEADKAYFKARYFQAVVKYLQGEHRLAIDNFYGLETNLDSEVGQEIRYNIAVANYNLAVSDRSKPRSLEAAISEFKEVVDKADDPEIKLLARAGLALSYAKQNEYLGKVDRRTGIEENSREIEIQHEKIKRTLASTQERFISDEVVKEVKLIMDQALNEDVGLPRRRRRTVWRLLRKYRFSLAIVGGFLVFWALILYVYFYLGVKYHF
jgi:hypothetical protein